MTHTYNNQIGMEDYFNQDYTIGMDTIDTPVDVEATLNSLLSTTPPLSLSTNYDFSASLLSGSAGSIPLQHQQPVIPQQLSPTQQPPHFNNTITTTTTTTTKTTFPVNDIKRKRRRKDDI